MARADSAGRVECVRCGRLVGPSWSLPDAAVTVDRRRLRRKATIKDGRWYWPVRHRVEYRNGKLGPWCVP